MGWLNFSRIPEPEEMDESGEIEAYASATAQAYLDSIDGTFVEHVLRLGASRGLALDIGTGPGQIPLKIARQLPHLEIIGMDLSEAMLKVARQQASALGMDRQVKFQLGNGNRLEFRNQSLDLVLCNSVLHHLQDPVGMLDEVARVVKPNGAVLLRDLRRPSRLAYALHVHWFGRYYSGKMRELFEASVRAAYTFEELKSILRQSKLAGANLFRFGWAHIGIERPARPAGV